MRGRGRVATAGAQPPTQAMEGVSLVNGRHYDGLVESSGDGWLYFIQIQRPPGQAMHLVIRTLDRGSVVSVAPLGEAERAALAGQIRQFINRATIEAGRMEAVALSPLVKEGNHYQHYAGKWFSLDSTADEQTTRRVIVRVEQIFAAYRQMLAPRDPPPPAAAAGGLQLDVALSGVSRRAGREDPKSRLLPRRRKRRGRRQRVEPIRPAHGPGQPPDRRDPQRVAGDEEGARPAGSPPWPPTCASRGTPPSRSARAEATINRQFQSDVNSKTKDLDRCDRRAAQDFQASTRQVFARVYHEAFHAYLENCVYPHRQYDVPRWLNEGLAVTFEGGILEADTLRVDAPNAAALKRLKADLAGPHPLSLQRLLSTDAGAFPAASRHRRGHLRSPLRLCLGPGLLPGLREAPLGQSGTGRVRIGRREEARPRAAFRKARRHAAGPVRGAVAGLRADASLGAGGQGPGARDRGPGTRGCVPLALPVLFARLPPSALRPPPLCLTSSSHCPAACTPRRRQAGPPRRRKTNCAGGRAAVSPDIVPATTS